MLTIFQAKTGTDSICKLHNFILKSVIKSISIIFKNHTLLQNNFVRQEQVAIKL